MTKSAKEDNFAVTTTSLMAQGAPCSLRCFSFLMGSASGEDVMDSTM